MKRVDIEELKGILQEARTSPLGAEDHAKLKGMVEAYTYLAELASEEGTTMDRIRERFFERFKFTGEGESRCGDDTAPSV